MRNHPNDNSEMMASDLTGNHNETTSGMFPEPLISNMDIVQFSAHLALSDQPTTEVYGEPETYSSSLDSRVPDRISLEYLRSQHLSHHTVFNDYNHHANSNTLLEFRSWNGPNILEGPVPAVTSTSHAFNDSIDHYPDFTNNNTNPPEIQDIYQAEQDQQADGYQCFVDSCGKVLRRSSDLKRHQKEQHDVDAEKFVCGCCDNKPEGFKRKEKLISHKKRYHGLTEGLNMQKCQENSCQGSRLIYFCTQSALELHYSHEHGYSSSTPSQQISAIEPNSCKICQYQRYFLHLTESLVVTAKERSFRSAVVKDVCFPKSVSKNQKRENEAQESFIVKRSRLDEELHLNGHLPRWQPTNKMLSQVEEFVDNPNSNTGFSNAELILPNVCFSDIITLLKSNGM